MKDCQKFSNKIKNNQIKKKNRNYKLYGENIIFKNIAKMLCSFYLPKNVYILLLGGIISVGDTYMNNGKEKNKENTKEEYKVNYFFAEDSKININEILKKSFLLSLKAERKM